MSFSLRIRVLVLVAAMNAALFAVGGVYLSDRFQEANDEQLQSLVETLDVLGARVRSSIDPQGSLNVAPILQWDMWSILDDAILVGREGLETNREGEILPSGIFLNPIGKARRSALFDVQAVLAAIVTAMEAGTPVAVEGGRALPILAGGGAWGGCWIRLQPPVDFVGMFRNLLPMFLLSTLILTAGTYWLLGRLVVGPVEALAQGARQVRGGDFSTRLREPDRRDELADLVRSFNAMTGVVQSFNERLEEEVTTATEKARQAEAAAMTQRRLAAMGELAAGIAHEINNPLGGLGNAVEALRREDLAPERRERYLDLLSTGLDRMGETVNRLRRFTPRQTSKERTDLAAIALDALDLVRHRAERSGVTLDLEPPDPEGFWVWCERNEIGQALLNLLSNSLDAIEEEPPAGGGRITVRLAHESGAVSILVQDNGPGVSAGELTQVADLFYTTKEVGKGTGLGLALVHQAVRSHRGEVEIHSEPGSGFSVRLRLPVEESR